MKYNKSAVALADLLESNKRVKFEIDNDYWSITEIPKPQKLPSESNEHYEDYDEPKVIADSEKYYWNTDWYDDSSNYGAGLAEALVILLNRRGFNIEASAV